MQYNWSIIGHEKQLQEIEEDFLSGNIAHAYLLAGPNSIGKYTVAKKMAGILQCYNNFCHTCPTCIQIQKGCHIDTIEMRDDKESIKIEEIRNLIDRLNQTAQTKYKILLIQTIERMTREAANSFLKILEEPPSKTIFILTSNNIRDVLPTVLSRVRIIKFSTVSVNYLVKKLTELYPDYDKQALQNVALFSMGKTGKAVHLIESPEALAAYQKVYYDVQNFLERKNIVDRFAYVEDILNDDSQVELFLSMLSHVLRSKLLQREKDSGKFINNLLKIEEAGILLKKNVNPRLTLENLMLVL